MQTTPDPTINAVTAFYTAFQQKDWAAMTAMYHPEAQFKDGAFSLHSGREAGAMWEMLIKSGKDLRIEYSDVKSDGNTGFARWDAWYTFSKTGKPVHNIIYARMEFKDGLIYRHTDHFNFWRWSRQALGLTGWLLGWTNFLQHKVQQTAMKNLHKFVNNH